MTNMRCSEMNQMISRIKDHSDRWERKKKNHKESGDVNDVRCPHRNWAKAAIVAVRERVQFGLQTQFLHQTKFEICSI